MAKREPRSRRAGYVARSRASAGERRVARALDEDREALVTGLEAAGA